MEFLNGLYLPGALAMWCALFFALASLWGYSQAIRGSESDREFGRRGYYFFALSIVLATFVLFVCLWRRDFRIEYVYQYSGLDLANHFQVAAFWAGQKGSFLIWLFWSVVLGLPLARAAGKDEAPVMCVYVMTLMGLLFILVRENPFVMLPETPADGAGLNPLLQDDWMVIHPPIMFIGYAASAIPFSFAMAALWQRDTSRWANRTFPWALGGFLVLGTAILMGGYWAYKTLGWGGYWGWDPVENASLIPWLLGTALIHGLHMERTRKRYRRANLVIACLLYISVLYGTFLTRSGVLADFSVHSFVDLGISGWLIALMAFFILSSFYLLVTRLRTVETVPNEDPMLSRGWFMVLATVVIGAVALVVTIGTSAPLLTFFLDNPGQVGPEFYNRVTMPLALLAAMLLGMVPFLTWKDTPIQRLRGKMLPSVIAGAVIATVAGFSGVHDPFHLLFVFLAGLALIANLHKTIDLARSKGFGRAGGYLAHVGVGCMFIGFLASSAYDNSHKLTLEQDRPQRIDDLTLTFKRFIPRDGLEKERMEIEVARDDGYTYMAYPKLFVNDRTRQLMANPHVKTRPLLDFYISPIQYEPGQPPGLDRRLLLAKEESGEAGDLEVRFVDFNLALGGDPRTQMASGGPVTIGADLEITRDEEPTTVTAVLRFEPNGRTDTPAIPIPGGGWVAMTGISPATGQVQLDFAGLGIEPQPAQLAIDITRKPLINLVWYGLYVVLFGGALATLRRFRQSQILDKLPNLGKTTG